MSRVVWKGDEFVRRSLLPSVRDGLAEAGQSLQDAIRQSINGPSPSAPGTPPGADTGFLRNSVSVAETGALSVGVGTNLAYGRFHEFGAIVRSKSGKYLTIPLTREAKFLRRRTASLRTVPGLTMVKSKKGNLLLGRRTNGGFEALFLLRKQTTLLARPWLGPGLRNNKGRVQKAFSSGTAKSLARRAEIAFSGGRA